MKKGVVPALVPDPNAAPASNTAATWTLAADASNGWAIEEIIFAYSGTPVAGTLTITWGTNTNTTYITSGGPGPLVFVPPIVFPINTQVVITLATGGVGISGAIMDVRAWKTQEGVGV